LISDVIGTVTALRHLHCRCHRRAGKEDQQSRQGKTLSFFSFIHILFRTVRASSSWISRASSGTLPTHRTRHLELIIILPFTTLDPRPSSLSCVKTSKMLHDETSLSYRPTYTRDQLALYVSCIAPDPSYALATLEAEIKADPLAALSRLQLRQMAFNPWGNVALHVSPQKSPGPLQLATFA